MNLTIDVGNSSTKYTLFDGKEINWHSTDDLMTAETLGDLISRKDVNHIIVSAVAPMDEKLQGALKEMGKKVLWLDSNTLVPVKNGYQTPKTLGTDRLAAVVGATVDVEGRNALVVDIGTCITYDIVDANGYFLGGNITAGLAMRLKALHEYTYKLPELEYKEEASFPFGQTTAEAICRGAAEGIKGEIDQHIKLAQQLLPRLWVVMTGGDLPKFAASFKKSKIVKDEHLVARGLNRILEYNYEKNR